MEVTLEDIRREKERRAQQEPNRERVRSMAQGLTFAASDEVEAFVRSMVPGSRDYTEIRDELRQKLSDYKKQYPGEALTYEIAGALVPSLAMMATGVGAPAGSATLGGKIAQVAKIGATQGGAYGLGASKSENIGGMARDTGLGAVTGLVVAPAIQLGLSGVGSTLGAVVNFAREKMGDKAATAVQAELQRLVEQTGKSVEEIVDDINNGRLMSDNKTLMIALKNLVNEGGESGRAVLERTQQRAAQTREEAMQALQGELTPGVEGNVIRAVRESDDAIRQAESQAYQSAYAGSEITPGVIESLMSAVSANPQIARELNKLYSTRNKIVPLFSVGDDGAVALARRPSIEDAEIVRRFLSDKTSQSYREGAGSFGEAYGGLESALRRSIDEASPQLSAARQQASVVRSARDAFELGRLSLSKNVDELELEIEKMSPEVRRAFQSGLMDAIRNKVRRSGTTLAKLADEDAQFGQVLRLATSPEGQPALTRQLGIAGDAAEVASKMPSTAGSPTSPLGQERARAGVRSSAEDVMRGARGDVTLVFDLADRVLRRQAPRLTDAQRMQVVDVLFSENPELVRRALTDETAASLLASKIGEVAARLSEGATRGAVQQSSGASTEMFTPAGTR